MFTERVIWQCGEIAAHLDAGAAPSTQGGLADDPAVLYAWCWTEWLRMDIMLLVNPCRRGQFLISRWPHAGAGGCEASLDK
jgi:hypothetical protein